MLLANLFDRFHAKTLKNYPMHIHFSGIRDNKLMGNGDKFFILKYL